MQPIGEFIEACRATEADFCQQHPHPVFVHAASERQLKPVADLTKQTFDRIVLDRSMLAGQRGKHLTPTRELDAIRPEHLYTIFVIRGQGGGERPLMVGCGFDCEVQINDESVSMRHAHVTVSGGQHRLRDNHSTTGTQINKELLQPGEERPLRSGDKVILGYVELTFLSPAAFHAFVRRLFID